MSRFQKASKAKTRARIALDGPSGSGKTFTALRVARGLAGPSGTVAVIDTERRSAEKYADRFAFDVCNLTDHSPAAYCAAIRDAHGFDVLVIDSISHAWDSLLEDVERIAKARYRGNSWSAWSEGTPIQKRFLNSILDFPGHVIATMRVKTEWTTSENDQGKKVPVKLGLAPLQGKSIEYEFDLLMELSREHIGTVAKDRSGRFQDQAIEKPGEEFGRELAEWLSDGVEAGGVASAPSAPPAVGSLLGDLPVIADPVAELCSFPPEVRNPCRRFYAALVGEGCDEAEALTRAVVHGRGLMRDDF